jgi:hypothetical protein
MESFAAFYICAVEKKTTFNRYCISPLNLIQCKYRIHFESRIRLPKAGGFFLFTLPANLSHPKPAPSRIETLIERTWQDMLGVIWFEAPISYRR